MKKSNPVQFALPRHPAGTTLSEVLVSMLVMSIGVVSLATLFPISVLRSVQATQLTNAANLRYNVEAMLGVMPQLYSIGAPWESGKNYKLGVLVTPTALTSLKSPPVVFQCIAAGNSDAAEPNWSFIDGGTTSEVTGVQWQTYRLQNYVIDPIGEYHAYFDDATDGLRGPLPTAAAPFPAHFFGNDGASYRPVIRAFSGINFSGDPSATIGARSAADEFVAANAGTLPDSWVNQVESTDVSNFTLTSCDLNDLKVDLSKTVPVGTTSRIVLFDSSGKVSHVRTITGIAGTSPVQTITWSTSSGPIPGFPFTPTTIPVRARIDTREERYTWLLSVRRGFSGASFMDVVVFFRRPFAGKDEQVFPATFTATTDFGFDESPGNQGIDDDGLNSSDDNGELGWPGSDDSPRNWVVVQYDATGNKPYLKKGGFVTDADNLRWYRILDIVEGDTFTALDAAGEVAAVMKKAGLNTALYIPDDRYFGSNTKAVVLRIENKITQSGPQPSAPGAAPTGKAILMRGIVDVFPIRTHLTWED